VLTPLPFLHLQPNACPILLEEEMDEVDENNCHLPPSFPWASFLASAPISYHFKPITVPALHTGYENSDNGDDYTNFQPAVPCETIHQQHVKSEWRRRDELRDGYHRLKGALPISNQKSSKISLLDQATTYIRYLEMNIQHQQMRLQQAESIAQQLHTVNEVLMFSVAKQHHAATVVASLQQSQSGFSLYLLHLHTMVELIVEEPRLVSVTSCFSSVDF